MNRWMLGFQAAGSIMGWMAQAKDPDSPGGEDITFPEVLDLVGNLIGLAAIGFPKEAMVAQTALSIVSKASEDGVIDLNDMVDGLKEVFSELGVEFQLDTSKLTV